MIDSVDMLEMGSQAVVHVGFIKLSDLVSERLRVGDSGRGCTDAVEVWVWIGSWERAVAS